MLNKGYIEDMTMAYIHSYNVAMKEVKNPNLATQIAMSVILAIHTTEQQKQQQQAGPFETLFAHIVAQMQGKGSEERYDREENETD